MISIHQKHALNTLHLANRLKITIKNAFFGSSSNSPPPAAQRQSGVAAGICSKTSQKEHIENEYRKNHFKTKLSQRKTRICRVFCGNFCRKNVFTSNSRNGRDTLDRDNRDYVSSMDLLVLLEIAELVLWSQHQGADIMSTSC